jgi:hypothetical protein
MPERIIIEFPEDNTNDKSNRLEIDINEEISLAPAEPKINHEEQNRKNILDSKINSFYKGSPNLNGFFKSDLKFPEGIDKSFRRKHHLEIKDNFLNSVLENNKYFVLSSVSGNVYFIDRFDFSIKSKIFIEENVFEKTGLVIENKIFVNSVKNIFEFKEQDSAENEIYYDSIYTSERDFFIWSNLNRYKNLILFLEYNPEFKKALLKIIDTTNHFSITEFEFVSNDFLSDSICIGEGMAYVLNDNKILICDLMTMEFREIKVDTAGFSTSHFLFQNYKFYFVKDLQEIFYVSSSSKEGAYKYSGIKLNYINSLSGYGENLFIGTIDGWKCYKNNGLLVYSFDDEYENKVECCNENLVVIVKKNKFVIHNLNRFQEAESRTVSSTGRDESDDIVSVLISFNNLIVLTKDGIIELYADDNLNIHI